MRNTLTSWCVSRWVWSDVSMVNALGASSWPTVSNHRAYLYRAVLNQARTEHRDRQRRWAKELHAATTDRDEMPEYRPEVLAAVRKLSLRQRATTVLTYWEDLAPDEIADRLGISEGAVRRHLARARSKLRGMLDE